MASTFGDQFKSLPLDPSQEFPAFDIKFIDGLRSKKAKFTAPVAMAPQTQKAPPVLKNAHDSDSDSDSSDDESESGNESTGGNSILNDLKLTFIAALLFIVCSNSIVDGAISKIGIDGIKLLFVKVFLFAILFFIVRYKFS
jgi:hypothetical protein